jgi:hypothetical protein
MMALTPLSGFRKPISVVQTVNVPEKSNPETLYRIRNLLPQWK